MQKFNLLNDELSVNNEREHIRKYVEKYGYKEFDNNKSKHYASVSKVFINSVWGDNLIDTNESLIDLILNDEDHKKYILKCFKFE